jgi:hypothetical protein
MIQTDQFYFYFIYFVLFVYFFIEKIFLGTKTIVDNHFQRNHMFLRLFIDNVV